MQNVNIESLVSSNYNTDTPLQEYLRTHTLEQMKAELGINYVLHPFHPLVKVKYDQIDSPKTHPVVRWARGTILERDTWKIVAQPFVRFFNLGENQPEMEAFNWKDFTAYEKLDGSLAVMYFYDGEWHFSTSGSFADGPIQYTNWTWEEAMFHGLNKQLKVTHVVDQTYKNDFNKSEAANQFDTDVTYIFEFCSPYTKIVRQYRQIEMYLLGAYQIGTPGLLSGLPYECHPTWVDQFATKLGLVRAPKFNFSSLEEVEKFMVTLSETDPTNEGVVLRDNTGIRFKVKSKTYLSLAHIHDNGNICNVKHLIPWVLRHEQDELLTYFPELTTSVLKLTDELQRQYDDLVAIWDAAKAIEVQKDFALAIVKKTPYTSILFNLRKKVGTKGTIEDLKEVWRTDDTLELVVKTNEGFKVEFDVIRDEGEEAYKEHTNVW
jgi:hypothetical protein